MSEIEDDLRKISVDSIKDYRPVSTPESIKSFLESGVYRDFIGELELRIEQLRDFLEVCDSKKFIATQGAVAFARLTLDIFNNLLANKLSDMEDEINNGGTDESR